MTVGEFRHFTEAWPEAHLLLTGKGHILAGNPAAERLLATDRQALGGRELSDEVLEPQGKVERFLKQCRRSPQLVLGGLTLRSNGSGRPCAPCRAEGTLLAPAGEETADGLIVMRLRPRGDVDGRFQVLNERIADLSREVLARREAEEKMRQLAEQLAEADRAKDVFLATLAHELRNPLSPLRTGAEIIRMKTDDPIIVGRMAEIIERQVKQLTVLVNDLLDVSRASRGKLEIRRERIRLEDAWRCALEMSGPLIEENGLVLVQSLPENSFELQADPARLAQIVSNLLNNAAKYSKPGGRIELSAERRQSELRIVVRDEGLGIPSGELENIFKIFTQLPQNRDRSMAGLGVGLTLVRKLVELHGGTVAASSPGENLGSTFEVRIPWVDPENPAPAL